jgi:hypothetical protein
MQSTQFKSDSINTNLTLNPANLEDQLVQNDTIVIQLDLMDPSFNDSLSVNYISPDSVICFGFRQEWSQFRKEFVPEFDYKKDLVRPLPYDSLHTVLKGVEVVFPGRKLMKNNPDWVIGILLICFLLFATVKLIFNKYLSQLFLATINYSAFSRLLRERYFNLLHASFRLDIIFNVIIALFGYQVFASQKINFGISGTFYLYLACLGGVIGYFTLKRFIYFLIGILTETREEVQEYLFGITVYNRVLGLFIFPVTSIIAFIPLSKDKPLLIFCAVIIGLFYLGSLLRGAKIFLKKQFSISYLILYLCTLEILPLLLLYNLLLF